MRFKTVEYEGNVTPGRRRVNGKVASGGQAAGDDQGDVIELFVGAEAADFVDNGGEQILGREMVMVAKGIDEARLTKFLPGRAERFGDAVGVQNERIAGRELTFGEGTIPIFESAHDGGGGGQTFERIVGAQEKRRKMATVRIAKTARGVVVFGEEECGESGVSGVIAEKLIDGGEQTLRVVHGDGALAAEIGLKIGHEKSRGDAFAGDIGDDEAEAILAEVEKVVVVATNVAGGKTESSKFQRFESR